MCVLRGKGAAPSGRCVRNNRCMSVAPSVHPLSFGPADASIAVPWAVPAESLTAGLAGAPSPMPLCSLLIVAISACAAGTTFGEPATQAASSLIVRGRVIADSTGLPLPGARIEVVGTALATTTDEPGSFAIALPGPGQFGLRVVIEGYEVQTALVTVPLEAGAPIIFRLTPHPLRLYETVVVAAHRDETPLFSVPRSMSVVSLPDLARLMPRTTPETLTGAAGVWVQKTNHGGGSPIVRGLAGNQVLLVVDGIRMNNSTYRYGPNQYLVTIDPRQIERLEVLRGSGSVLFGSDAIGGVVNIVSKRPRFTEGGLRVSGEAAAKVMTGGMEQSGRLNLAIEHSRAAVRGGLSLNNFGDLHAGGDLGVEAPSGYSTAAGDLTALARVSPRNLLTFGAQGDYQADVPRFDQVAQRGYSRYAFDPQVRQLGYARLQHFGDSRWARTITATASLQRSRERRERQVRGASTLVTEQDTVRVLGGTIEVRSTPSPRWTILSGIDVYRDVVGSWRRDTDLTSGRVTAKRGLYPDGATSLAAAAFAQGSLTTGRVHVDLGARYSHVRVSATDTQFGRLAVTPHSLIGSAAASVEIANGWRLLGSLAQAFRAPNVDDLSTLGPFDYGIEIPSPGLKPERSLSVEVGLNVRRDTVSASAAVYRSLLDDLIDRVRSTLDGSEWFEGQRVYQKANVGSAYVQGAELQGEWRVGRGVEGFGHLTYTYGQQTTLDQPMRRIPPLNGLAGIRWRPSPRAWIEASLRFASAQRRLSSGDRDDHRIPPGGTPGWKVVDVRVAVPVARRLHLTAGVQNLFNEAYRLHGSGIDGVGRSAWIGTQVGF